MRRVQSPRSFLVGFLLVPVVFWAGCGEDTSLTAPATTDSVLELQGAPIKNDKPASWPWYVVASEKVSPGEGPAIVTGSRYTITLDRGSFQRATTVVMMERDPGKLDVQLFPDGLIFEGGVTLTVDYSGTIYDPSSPTYAWGPVRMGHYDTAAKEWTVLPGTIDTEAKTYTVTLTGFSRYASGDAIRSVESRARKIPPPAQID